MWELSLKPNSWTIIVGWVQVFVSIKRIVSRIFTSFTKCDVGSLCLKVIWIGSNSKEKISTVIYSCKDLSWYCFGRLHFRSILLTDELEVQYLLLTFLIAAIWHFRRQKVCLCIRDSKIPWNYLFSLFAKTS